MQDIKAILNTPLSSFTAAKDDSFVCIRPAWVYVREGELDAFRFRLPKIPANIYTQIVSLFKKVAYLCNTEALARVYYNPTTCSYVLNVPPQKASVATVTPLDNVYDTEIDLFENIPVLEIHSHGKEFDAFFSMTDDVSELHKYAIYGVFSFIGNNSKSLFRLCLGGESVSLDVSDIFELPDSEEYDAEFVKQILQKNKILFN